jgi:hypothetical protein
VPKPPPPQERDELEDDPPEDEPEGEQEEAEDEEEIQPAAPLKPPTRAETPLVSPSYRASPGKKGKGSKGLSGPKQAPRFNQDGIEVWNQVISQLEAGNHSPYDVQILVQAPGNAGQMAMGTIDGGTVAGGGSVSPGEALLNRLEDGFHLLRPNSPPVVYTLKFQWKTGGLPFKTAAVILPSKNEILAMREQRMRDEQSQGQAYGPPTGMGRPWGNGHGGAPPQAAAPAYVYPPQYAQPNPAYYPPPPPQPQPQGVDPYIRQSIETLTSMLNEVREENARLRNQPPPAPFVAPPMPVAAPPPPPQAPPPAAMTEEGIARLVMMTVQTLVPHLRQPTGAGATPSTPTMESELMQASQTMVHDMFKEVMGAVFKRRSKEISSGLGAPMEVPAPSEGLAEVVEPPNPQDSLPFTQVPLEAKFADGRAVIFPVDKETGSVNVMGAIFSNPFVVEKLADGVNALTHSLADAVKKVGAGGPHIVHRTPGGAQDGNPKPGSGNMGGSGWD